MGLKRNLVNLITDITLQDYPKLSRINILELGNQEVRSGEGFFEKTGKEYWTNQGLNHVSVDLNGKNGALKKDLTEIDQFLEFQNKFEVVYNSGTTEHVEPYESQYEAFRIIDFCTKVNGFMFHSVPEITNRDNNGIWEAHCHYYYSKEFFDNLAKECNYELLYLKVLPTNVTCAFKKTENSSFMIDKELFLSEIAVRNKNLSFKGNPDYTFQNKEFNPFI